MSGPSSPSRVPSSTPSAELYCLLLGMGTATGEPPLSGGFPVNGRLGRRVRLMLQQRSISASSPRKLFAPVKTTASVTAEIARASFVLAEVSHPDPVVFFYLGLARAQGKPIVSLRRFDAVASVPVHRQAEFAIDFEDSGPGHEELAKRLDVTFDSIERSERLDHGVLLGIGADFELDWSKLSPTGHENLCFELVLRQGFRELSWLGDASEAKLTALRPRPDGRFDLFVIAAGTGLEDSFAVRGWLADLEVLGQRLIELFHAFPLAGDGDKIDLNLLFLWSPHRCEGDRVHVDLSHATNLAQTITPLLSAYGKTLTCRLGYWHRTRIESLTRRWPMLVRQYFALEPSSEPTEHRKSLEDL